MLIEEADILRKQSKESTERGEVRGINSKHIQRGSKIIMSQECKPFQKNFMTKQFYYISVSH